MQRVLSFFSAFVLTSFLLLIVVKIDIQMTEQDTVSVEEMDLEDILEDESEEIEFQLKDFSPLLPEALLCRDDQNTLFNYHFAIKPNSQEVHSLPPEA